MVAHKKALTKREDETDITNRSYKACVCVSVCKRGRQKERNISPREAEERETISSAGCGPFWSKRRQKKLAENKIRQMVSSKHK